MLPPEVRVHWDKNNWWLQTLVIAYNQIRDHEETELLKMQFEAGRSIF